METYEIYINIREKVKFQNSMYNTNFMIKKTYLSASNSSMKPILLTCRPRQIWVRLLPSAILTCADTFTDWIHSQGLNNQHSAKDSKSSTPTISTILLLPSDVLLSSGIHTANWILPFLPSQHCHYITLGWQLDVIHLREPGPTGSGCPHDALRTQRPHLDTAEKVLSATSSVHHVHKDHVTIPHNPFFVLDAATIPVP